VDDPRRINPQVVQSLVSQDLPVVGLYEVQRSLEKVYLQAISEDTSNHQVNEPSVTQVEIEHAG
jgi:hypothetical protein